MSRAASPILTNHAFDRGYCDQDRRHLGVVTVGYQTPAFVNPVWRALGSNWRVSGVLNARSGDPRNVIAGGDPAFNGIVNQRPVKVRDNPYPAEKTLLTYLDRAAFAQPAPGTLGDFPRNGVRGPGYWDINVACPASSASAKTRTSSCGSRRSIF